MKLHTNDFKEQIKTFGRQKRTIITYNNTILEEELYSVTPHYEANLLKSVMKELEIESLVDIDLGTIINCQIGILVNNDYEMLDYGNYVVYKSEKQEDTNTYKITCYDKMLYAMKNYENIGVTYPITIKNYLNSIANYLGLTFANAQDTFVNSEKQILTELYLDSEGNSLGYTFRDVLDELSQVTASNIVINDNDELEVRYFNFTQDTINEEYLKDINVKFGEKYGEINTIVLSRSAGSDKIYKSYPENLPEEDRIAIEISDNQIMNFNDRDQYMSGILNKLQGFYFYLNDFNSTGICYYDVCDVYNIQIGENIYQCVMLNDEINITTGLEEIIHTEMPEGSQTDYTKADKTDRRINQTYLIVDKQNQKIESVINNVTEQNTKINQITQTVDELNSKIGDIADITTSQETNNASLTFTDINQSEPIRIVVHPIGVNISYLYPRSNLYPNNSLYMTDRKIRFTNTDTDEVIDYELPTDLLYYDSNNYDEFILDYDAQTCIVNKKVGYNADGSTYVLATPQTLTFTYPQILLTDGDYTIELLGYNIGYLMARLMSQNIYTTQFATKAELSSSITQTANEINLRVDEKLDEEDFTSANILLKINNDESSATINADKINLNGAVTANENFKIKTDGSMEAYNGKFIGGEIELTGADNISKITINGTSANKKMNIGSNYWEIYDSNGDVKVNAGLNSIGQSFLNVDDTSIWSGTGITTPQVIQTSLESAKKNFNKFNNGLDIIKNIDIYEYNLKAEDNNNKKHIGFVIGDNFKYSEVVTSNKNDGVDIYSFVSVCCKAIQEQQEQIEGLKEEIKKLGGNK